MFLLFLYTIHVLTCIFLILVVLLQRGKGADLSVFGGGTTQAAFGARGTATLLHKLTVGFFVGFIVTTLSIAMVQSRSHGTTVLSGVDEEAAATTEEAGATEDGATVTDGAAVEEGALTPSPDGAAGPADGGAEASAEAVPEPSTSSGDGTTAPEESP